MSRTLIAMAAVACLTFGNAAYAQAVGFNPEEIISDGNMRDFDSMSAADVQAFLEVQQGPLKSLVTSDHDEVITLSTRVDNLNSTPDVGEAPKPASQIIWEACQAWQISPKVMLTMLQKEQSLLTKAASAKTLARAVGAGVPGSLVYPTTNPVATNRYPGFGNQLWHGARLLSSYGEGHPSFPTWRPGMRKTIYEDATYGTVLYPENLATFKLYVYNPSIPGNMNFSTIYRTYFGDPMSDPASSTVIVPTSGKHGSISPNTPQIVAYGTDSPAFAVKPNRGYRVDDVKVDGVSVGAVKTYTFKYVRSDHTITATFVANARAVGAPVAPKTMRRSRSYTIRGTLRPTHSSGLKAVRIYKYQKVAGTWKPAGFVTAKTYNDRRTTRYRAKMKLPKSGRWRLRAYAVADTQHLAIWSKKYDYVKVR